MSKKLLYILSPMGAYFDTVLQRLFMADGTPLAPAANAGGTTKTDTNTTLNNGDSLPVAIPNNVQATNEPFLLLGTYMSSDGLPFADPASIVTTTTQVAGIASVSTRPLIGQALSNAANTIVLGTGQGANVLVALVLGPADLGVRNLVVKATICKL